MTKKDEIIDQTLQLLAYSDKMPLKYKQLKKFMDDYIINEKKTSKSIKKKINEKNDIKDIYQRFVQEHLEKNINLQKILDLWEIRKNELSI